MKAKASKVSSMQKSHRSAGVLLVAALLSSVAAYIPPGKTDTAVRSDIPYIRCGVCEALAKNAYRQVKAMRDQLKPGKKLSEMDIIEKIEKITDPDQPEGEWISKIDLVEKGSLLTLVEQEDFGVCGVECKTISKAAEEIVGDADTDIAEALWKGTKERAAFTNWMCRELTSSCRKAPPPLPAGRKKGPAFMVGDKQDMELNRMMANMRGQGMKGSLYSRDEAAKMAAGGPGMSGEGDDDDDDDDEDDASPVSGTMGQIKDTVSDAVGKAKGFSEPLISAAADGVAKARVGLASLAKKAAGAVSGLTGMKGVESDEL